MALALEQRQHALRGLVGLREHARAGLLQDVQLRELGHLRRHVHVTDARLGRRQVLLVGRQVGQTVLQAVLDRAVAATDTRDVLGQLVDRGQGAEGARAATTMRVGSGSTSSTLLPGSARAETGT